MRVSLEWLQEYVKIELTAAELADKLTMAGVAVEEIEDQAVQYTQMITVKVLEISKHPQADNLWIVMVQTGQEERQIVTAAKNLEVGMVVPLALPGALLPNGKRIEDATLKGVLSRGMFCSGEELGLEKESAGIWVFPANVNVGLPVAEVLGATDQILVLELTPNRADCLGMIGVAREVAAILGRKSNCPKVEITETGTQIKELAGVKVDNHTLCPRYSARVIQGIKIQPAPEWMQRRLKAAGIRSINNIVDITNYVMLEYNQPLHAFDLDRIAKQQIIVRTAKPGEKLITLDEVVRELDQEALLITDSEQSLCVAGVMGGATSEVTEQTVNLFLESAYFQPTTIRKTARRLGMKTESSFRFERGLDPNQTVAAVNRAAELILKYAGGSLAQGVIDFYPEPIAGRVIKTNTGKINGLLGTELSTEKIVSYLERLTFVVKKDKKDELTVTVPTYRPDVSQMADLAEEIARLHGYDQIPIQIPASRQIGMLTGFQQMQATCRRFLQGAGLTETITYSFYSREVPSQLLLAADDLLSQTISLLTPLTEEQAVMRTNLVHNLLETIAFNNKHRQENLAIFELARVYLAHPGEDLPNEPMHLGIALSGRRQESGWNQAQTEYDFYDLKGLLEALCEKLALPELILKRATQPFLHPGQSAEFYLGEVTLGFMGQVHPKVCNSYGIAKGAFVIELDLTKVAALNRVEHKFVSLPKYPALERDLALVVDKKVEATKIITRIKEIGGSLVEQAILFDVYQGGQVPDGMRSLAFSISYRSAERTLNDLEVNQIQVRLLEELKAEYGAVIRS